MEARDIRGQYLLSECEAKSALLTDVDHEDGEVRARLVHACLRSVWGSGAETAWSEEGVRCQHSSVRQASARLTRRSV